jgi:hypothetical protein
LLSILFVLATTGSAMYWYRQGTGRHYAVLRAQGIEHALAAMQAHTSGLFYSAFMIGGLSLPLFLLTSVSLGIVLFHKDRRFKAARWVGFFAVCALGTASMAVAQNILSHGLTPLLRTFVATSFIWIAIGLCFLGLIGFVSFIRLIFGRDKSSRTF